jgi:hypothetical protein
MRIRGTLVVAGVVAIAAGLGCAHGRAENKGEPGMAVPRQLTPSTTPEEIGQQPGTLPPGQPGVAPSESATGGSGQTVTPSTPAPAKPAQPQGSTGMCPCPPGQVGSGIGGSGTYDQSQNPDNCDRSQIGSPNSPGVDCDRLQGSDSTLPGTGGSGATDIGDQNTGVTPQDDQDSRDFRNVP